MSYDIDNPPLPAGYNCDDNDGDYVNGSGTNWPVWPFVFDSYEGYTPLIITQEMMDIFAKECPDYVVPCENNTVVLPRGIRVAKLKEVA